MKHIKTYETVNTLDVDKKIFGSAINNSDFDTIKKYVDSGFDFNTYPEIFNRIIYKFLTKEDIEISKLIIDSGFDVNNINIVCIEYLISHLYQSDFYLNLISILIDAGLDVKYKKYPYYIIHGTLPYSNKKSLNIAINILFKIIKNGFDLSITYFNLNFVEYIDYYLDKDKSEYVLKKLYSKIPTLDEDIKLAIQAKKYNI